MFIVFDLDGTLADDSHRQHHITGDVRDWDAYFAACGDDAPVIPVINIFNALLAGEHYVEIWTGRSDAYKERTNRWLGFHGVGKSNNYDYGFRMRADGDFRPDTEVKGEWLAECGDHPPDLIFDDRTKSVAFWRSHGITCLQVAQHDY